MKAVNPLFLLASLALVSYTSSTTASTAVTDKPLCQRQVSKTQSALQIERVYTQCLDQQINKIKREIKTWQNKRESSLEKLARTTGNPAPLSIFHRAQSRYANYTEDSCRWRYLRLTPNTTKAAIAFKECEIRLLKSQLLHLKQAVE